MIAALLLSAHLAAADRPFVLSWIVNWGDKRSPTTLTARFETPEEAFAMYEKAPMCGESKEPPCVIWAHVNYESPATAKPTSNK